MKRRKQYIGMAIAMAMLLIGSCQQGEVIDRNGASTSELKFRPSLDAAQTATRAGESDNAMLQTASAAGENTPHLVIETYTGTPGSSLKEFFSDELGYFESAKNWDLNSGTTRFLPAGGMNLYAYFATNTADKGDLTDVEYIAPPAADNYPKLTFTATTDTAHQVDLIAAKMQEINSSDIRIPFRHILSQINFGVKGVDEHQVTVKNIRIHKVMDRGSFDYDTWQWTPDTEAPPLTYSYYFPDTDASSGENYKTQGAANDSQNTYLFGDGGKFGPGSDPTFLYAQTDHSASNYATAEKTSTPLRNSLMLLPQEITKNTDATVTFDYEISQNGQLVRSGENNVIRLDAYYDWKPNLRYVYLFNFDNPSQEVTFDVLVEEWQNYNGDDGIVGTDELNSTTLFQKYIRSIEAGGDYTVPLGPLSSDFLCDWSLFSLANSFDKGETFTLIFDSELPFINGKSIIIHPPFGFAASTSLLTGTGIVTFTASPYAYFSTSGAVRTAIMSGSGNYEFSVSDAVKLEEITFTGSPAAEFSLTLHYPNTYKGIIPSGWSVYDKTAVYYPNAYALTNNSAPYAYTVYTVQGLKAILDWMNDGGTNPGGSDNTLTPEGRMQTSITLVPNGSYNLAEVYKANASDSKLEFVPIGISSPYTGTFDGKGATVSNLYLNTGYTNNVLGFFNNVTGTVQHVNLTNVSVTSTGDWTVGGLIGLNNGTIQGCRVEGTIQGTGGVTGGIAGQNKAFIYACSSTAAVNGSSSNVGGITGYNDGQVWSCYATNGKNVVGVNANTVKTSYYVSSTEISTVAGATRVPSIAALNGKIAELNETIIYVPAHFVSGNLNATPPSIAAGSPASRGKGGVLKGTFIQNSHALRWGQDRWNEEIAVLATLGMEYLVLDQVMEYSDYAGNSQYISWYKPSTSVLVNEPISELNASETALEFCMNACRTHGIKLFIGTFFDKRYWDDGKAITNPVLWNNCITTSNNIMKDLTSLYFSTGSTKNYTDVLAGWYFPYEVDDLNFQTSDAQTLLTNGIKTAITCRDGLTATAKKPYLFSPFMNGSGPHAIKDPITMDATQYAALWEGIIKDAGFQSGDILSPQDCIGTGKFLISDIHDWMPKLQVVAEAKGVEFWINIELFTPNGSASNVSDLTGQQIPASNKYATKLISFSYPIYYSPNSKDKQGDHKAYKAYYDAQ